MNTEEFFNRQHASLLLPVTVEKLLSRREDYLGHYRVQHQIGANRIAVYLRTAQFPNTSNLLIFKQHTPHYEMLKAKHLKMLD